MKNFYRETAQERREQIMALLNESGQPLSYQAIREKVLVGDERKLQVNLFQLIVRGEISVLYVDGVSYFSAGLE